MQSRSCQPTVVAAVQAYAHMDGARVAGEGYRVAAVRRDPLRKRGWWMVERCDKPAEPMVAVAMSEETGALLGASERQAPVIHIGDAVSVWARYGQSQMEVHGWAEESGAVASRIRVRLPRWSDDSEGGPPRIVCVVTGAGRAEVTE